MVIFSFRYIMSTRDIATKHALSKYYSNSFPVSVIWKWLQTASKPENREFSFCEDNHPYNRYNSFATESEFQSFIIERTPQRIDIGAVYNFPPHKKSKQPNQKQTAQNDNFKPELAEFKVDIDIPDYGNARLCHCTEIDSVCKECWPLINLAIVVLTDIFENDFAYTKQIWFFSGKKGAHGWICDDRTKRLDDEGRSHLTNFLQIFKRNASLKKRDEKSALAFNRSIETHMSHPTFKRIYKKYLLPFFEAKLRRNIGAVAMAGFRDGIAGVVANDAIVSSLDSITQSPAKTDEEKWSQIKSMIHEKSKTEQDACAIIKRIVFWFTYPRLDENVSKPTNHLLKSPFVIHPETLRICLPITRRDCIERVKRNGVECLFDSFFDPFTVPLLVDNVSTVSKGTKSELFYDGIKILEDFVNEK